MYQATIIIFGIYIFDVTFSVNLNLKKTYLVYWKSESRSIEMEKSGVGGL